MERHRTWLMVAAAGLVLAACRVDASVAVRAHDDGTGSVVAQVRLDRDAVQAAVVGGGSLEQRFRIDDLRGAGWDARWHVGAGEPPASATLSLEKRFARPAQVRTIIGELSGRHGPLRVFSLHRDPAGLRTTFRFRGLADLARVDAGVAADPELAGNLAGQHVDVTGLDASLTTRVKDALRLTVRAQLPGGTRAWTVAPGSRAVLATSSSTWDATRLVWLAAGAVLALAAIVLFVAGARAARRGRLASR